MTTVLAELTTRLKRSEPYRALLTAPGRSDRLPGAAGGWVLGQLAEDLERPMLVVVPHEVQARAFLQGARLFGLTAEQFSAPSLTPYQAMAPSLSVRAQEVVALDRVVRGEVRILVATARALFRFLPSPAEFESEVMALAVGQARPMELVIDGLLAAGYVRRDLVSEVGEFAVRGGVTDCFPVGRSLPVRIEHFGDDVETIRSFDPDDQRSCEQLSEVRVPPVTLFSRPRALEEMARRLRSERLGFEATRQVERALEGEPFAGWENFLPLLAEEKSTLKDWLGAGSLTVVVELDAVEAEVNRHRDVLERDYEARAEAGQMAVAPELLEHSATTVLETVQTGDISVGGVGAAAGESIDFGGSLTDLFVEQLPRFPAEVGAARTRGERVLMVVESSDHRGRFERLCQHYSLELGHGGVEIVEGRLDRGFRLPLVGAMLISEAQLFRRPPATRRTSRAGAGAFAPSLRDLRVGDFVVHDDHGIGQFVGLRVVATGDEERRGLPPVLRDEVREGPLGEQEVLEIRYSGDQTLLLPPSRLDLIQRYGGAAEAAAPKLDRLGGTSWARAKERVRAGVRALAVDLLALYARRQLSKAPKLGADSDLQRQFEAAFAYEPTGDQVESLGEIKADLESDRPMDRLLCGDVGFGKTEVAMRAAFKVVDGGYQVAVLAPTTVLADQHFETFRERFSEFPVEVDMVSRFRSGAEIRKIRERVANGGVDILIGTHRLLSRDISFARLGLLVVDEEQRFGVAQKEKLKELKKDLHVLALSATPVPRTLQLSLAGVRDLSTIETPPRDRLAIETAIVPYSPVLVREAIEYEIDRGGQVYYVFNRVAGIGTMAETLRKTCPGVRVVVGHGQLDEGELSRRMHEFKAGEHDVLLATTIIENGIDIPNVNTMIVHHADRFGLAQLYQLRGRVGRSNQLAYCYLTVSPDRTLTETSRQRLEAIREFSELGAGFRVAARDLEIRGAGDFLGAEQSGHIAAVGIETYLKLLDESVRQLRGETIEAPISTSIKLPVAATIPEGYVEEANLRMEIYRRIAASAGEEELGAELADRFGPMPQEVESLIGIAGLRRLAEGLRVQAITGRGRKLKLRFRHDTKVPADGLIRYVGENPAASFSPTGVLTIEAETDDWVGQARRVLEVLAP